MINQKILVTTLATLALMIPAVASAQSPHFISASDALSTTDPGDLLVSWKEAGLGNDAIIHYVASADSTATYACINGGGNHPQASNKETVNGPVTASGTFPSGKNGSIPGTLTVEEPNAGSFSCPGGQSLVLASVSFTNVSICDTTNNPNVCENLVDQSQTFCDINNLTKATVKNCVIPD
jgi:hypothetical protein